MLVHEIMPAMIIENIAKMATKPTIQPLPFFGGSGA